LPSDFVKVANMITYKRKIERGTTPEETCMRMAKDVLVKAFNLSSQ
jgi:hypothetical protein